MRSLKRVAFLILISLATSSPVFGAKTIDLDSATIADINAAFKAGTLTAEGLVQLCLARIRSYDREGPSLHAVIALNPKAIETARELDAERKSKGPRSALHGIPVVLKDNYNTADLATTGGTKFEIIERLQSAGLVVKDVVVVIDREQGAAQAIRSAGLGFHALATLRQLLDAWQRHDIITATQRREVDAYLAQSLA